MENTQNTMLTTNFVIDSMLNPSVFDQLQRSATLFSKSGLVPDSFKNNVAACFVGLQLAGAIGCNPFMLFQGLYSVSGRIGLETKVAVAIANQKGVFTSPITHAFKGEGKARSCTATATLSKSGKEVSITVDWETVEKEGWNKRSGSKWNTMPDQMFRYRSSMWLIRTYAPEVLVGLSSVDEIEDAKIIDITPARIKKIDEAFGELAKESKGEENGETSEVVGETMGEAATVGEKPSASETAEAVPAEKLNVGNNIIEKISAYNIKPSAMTVYIVKTVGLNKGLEELSEEEAQKLLSYIEKIKGENKQWNTCQLQN